nr:DUF1330 domain-containing protein [Geoalkalibacter halelectricus]
MTRGRLFSILREKSAANFRSLSHERLFDRTHSHQGSRPLAAVCRRGGPIPGALRGPHPVSRHQSGGAGGAHPYDHTVVIAFTDQDSLGRWFHSELYQSLIPLRDRAADVVIISYDA